MSENRIESIVHISAPKGEVPADLRSEMQSMIAKGVLKETPDGKVVLSIPKGVYEYLLEHPELLATKEV